MFKQLYIRNYTIISELDIHFYPGFSVITGETGAGKSIILEAISLLMGSRADNKTIRLGQEKCLIEAHFDISRYHLQSFFEKNDIDYDLEDCILRREIFSNGKSRAFINDTPAPLSALKELGEQLIDIHSQHQNLLLNKEDFQLQVVDIIAQDDLLVKDFQQQYNHYRKEEEKLQQLKEAIAKGHENEDFMRFQFNELSQAQLIQDEQESLEQELETLTHFEEIKNGLFNTDLLLSGETEGIVDSLRNACQQVESIKIVYPSMNNLAERLDSVYIELKDISKEINTEKENIDFDPQRLEQIQNRLDVIYSLEHKFHVANVNELLDLQNQLKDQLATIDNSDESIRQQQIVAADLLNKCLDLAGNLTNKRKQASEKIEKEMLKRLAPLGIPSVQFKVQISDKPLANNGKDRVSFLFSGNTKSPLQPVSQVASGGEISRVMLSLKSLISNTVNLPTIIFDEIDTGVSGKVAEKMAKMMHEMGQNSHQVISITHLPQIAATGEYHYSVSKEETSSGTESKMIQLTTDQRVQEIAKMLSGSNITAAALANATELLHAN